MLDGEDGTLNVLRRLRVEEDGVPVLAGPGAFGLGSE